MRSRRRGDEQHTPLLLAPRVHRIHRLEEPLRLHSPRLVFLVHVENEHEILVGQIGPYRRVVATGRAEERAAIEVDHVSPTQLVRVAELIAKLLEGEVA